MSNKELEKEFKIKREPKTSIGKAWNWVWHSDSIWSWLVALIIAFIIVKFIFFPLLSLALGTKLPLVVVESGSMSHPGSFLGDTFGTQGSFDKWWNLSSTWYLDHGITKEQAQNWPLRTGMEKGDIIIIWGHGKPKVGDIIVFNADTIHPIIHRIIRIDTINGEQVYSTKGDNYLTNPDQLQVEKQIPGSAVIGRSVFKIPKLGWIKLLFVDIANGFSGQSG